MTVRYRPICLHQAWRSQLSHSLTSGERYGELYFLTNPATNSIGCYQVIPRISGAELGMSTEELQNVINRLEEMKVVIYKDGHILVRTWFFHSTWESTQQGNVLKTALADIRRIPASLQPYWRDSCVEAGVPESVVDEVLQQALASPLQGTCKGLSHVTNTKQKANQKPTTTTTQLVSVVAASLELLPCAEPHRDTLLTLAREHGLTESQLQDLGWELSARLHAAEQGQGKPIGLVARWLSALAHALQEGTPILQAGRELRDKRKRTRSIAEREKQEAQAQSQKRADDESERLSAEAALASLDDSTIQTLIDKVPSITTSRDQAARCREALQARVIPPSCAIILKPLLRETGLLPASKESQPTT